MIATPWPGATHGGVGGSAKLGSDRPSVGKKGCSVPVPPASAAGLVQAARQPAWRERPKSEFAGGGAVARKDA